MDIETLLTSTKWDILREIARKPQSPTQLAEKLGTSVANVSTQLRLLETANFVKKTKTGSARAGKPRYLFSISRDFAHVSSVGEDLTFKDTIIVSDHQKSSLAIWRLQKQYQGPVQKFLFTHDELFDSDVYVETSNERITFYTIGTQQKTIETLSYRGQSYTVELISKPTYEPKSGHTKVSFGGKGS